MSDEPQKVFSHIYYLFLITNSLLSFWCRRRPGTQKKSQHRCHVIHHQGQRGKEKKATTKELRDRVIREGNWHWGLEARHDLRFRYIF